MSRRVIDLSLPIKDGMLRFPPPWHCDVEVKQLGHISEVGRETRRIVLGSHSGTHCDAPAHFVDGGGGLETLDLEVLVGPARLADFTALGPGGEVSLPALQEALSNQVPQRLVMRYGWSQHWDTDRYYRDYPFLSKDAAAWLVDGGIRLLGLDTPSPDNPAHGPQAEEDSPLHKLFLEAQVVLVEYLANLHEISGPEFELIVAPLNIPGADGSPCRVFALEEN